MKLKCYINGKLYDGKLIQGVTISEEYNETLDSGTIIIDRVPKIENIKPYDDVFLYEDNGEEFDGYWPEKDIESGRTRTVTEKDKVYLASTLVSENPEDVDKSRINISFPAINGTFEEIKLNLEFSNLQNPIVYSASNQLNITFDGGDLNDKFVADGNGFQPTLYLKFSNKQDNVEYAIKEFNATGSSIVSMKFELVGYQSEYHDPEDSDSFFDRITGLPRYIEFNGGDSSTKLYKNSSNTNYSTFGSLTSVKLDLLSADSFSIGANLSNTIILTQGSETLLPGEIILTKTNGVYSGNEKLYTSYLETLGDLESATLDCNYFYYEEREGVRDAELACSFVSHDIEINSSTQKYFTVTIPGDFTNGYDQAAQFKFKIKDGNNEVIYNLGFAPNNVNKVLLGKNNSNDDFPTDAELNFDGTNYVGTIGDASSGIPVSNAAGINLSSNQIQMFVYTDDTQNITGQYIDCSVSFELIEGIDTSKRRFSVTVPNDIDRFYESNDAWYQQQGSNWTLDIAFGNTVISYAPSNYNQGNSITFSCNNSSNYNLPASFTMSYSNSNYNYSAVVDYNSIMDNSPTAKIDFYYTTIEQQESYETRTTTGSVMLDVEQGTNEMGTVITGYYCTASFNGNSIFSRANYRNFNFTLSFSNIGEVDYNVVYNSNTDQFNASPADALNDYCPVFVFNNLGNGEYVSGEHSFNHSRTGDLTGFDDLFYTYDYTATVITTVEVPHSETITCSASIANDVQGYRQDSAKMHVSIPNSVTDLFDVNNEKHQNLVELRVTFGNAYTQRWETEVYEYTCSYSNNVLTLVYSRQTTDDPNLPATIYLYSGSSFSGWAYIGRGLADDLCDNGYNNNGFATGATYSRIEYSYTHHYGYVASTYSSSWCKTVDLDNYNVEIQIPESLLDLYDGDYQGLQLYLAIKYTGNNQNNSYIIAYDSSLNEIILTKTQNASASLPNEIRLDKNNNIYRNFNYFSVSRTYFNTITGMAVPYEETYTYEVVKEGTNNPTVTYSIIDLSSVDLTVSFPEELVYDLWDPESPKYVGQEYPVLELNFSASEEPFTYRCLKNDDVVEITFDGSESYSFPQTFNLTYYFNEDDGNPYYAGTQNVSRAFINSLGNFISASVIHSYEETRGEYIPNSQKFGFYKHFLIDSIHENHVNLYHPDVDKRYYKYQIELFSETKGLETIQLPNISITQSIKMFDENGNKLKRTVWEYLNQYVDLYSPKIRIINSSSAKTWKYVKKYVLDVSLKDIFDNVYAPEKSWNCPNLRDVLADLMLVKDCIPYVEDGVIKALDITKRTGDFINDKNSINFINSTLSSQNYATNLRRTYSNALSQDNSIHMVEYMGFRNSSTPLMTLENMRLETRFPIYKINKIYMCYYKKAKILPIEMQDIFEVSTEPPVTAPASQTTYIDSHILTLSAIYIYNNTSYYYLLSSDETTYVRHNEDVTDGVFLCKQNITPLVKLDSERNILSSDWRAFKNTPNESWSIEELAKYKISTVGYSIGSNVIEGWGTKYSYPIDDLGWFKKEASCVQNIANFMDYYYPYGIYDNDYFANDLNIGGSTTRKLLSLDSNGNFLKNVETVFGNEGNDNFMANVYDLIADTVENINGDEINVFRKSFASGLGALKLKSFIFIVDYQGFYNGSIVHSKDFATDEITMNDNSSASLTVLEQDGLFQKEKINRYGNKDFSIPARYKDDGNGTALSKLQKLGSVYSDEYENDVIIYHRDYQIWENEVVCNYRGAKDYVLKNYFTTVYAKHRTYSLMSYGESVRRSENRKMMLLLSKNRVYYEGKENQKLNFKSFSKGYLPLLFSAFEKDNEPQYINDFQKDEKLNYAYIMYKNQKYLSDVGCFVSGNSLCINLAMFDNVSSGVYISDAEPDYQFSVEKDHVGSVQSWYMIADRKETGFVSNLGFYISHINQENYFNDKFQSKEYFNINSVYSKLLSMPLVTEAINQKNVIYSNENICKDNKELLDMTFQFEPISDSDDIVFSQWLMKLSSLISTNNKIASDFESYLPAPGINIRYFYLKYTAGFRSVFAYMPTFFVKLNQTEISDLIQNVSKDLNGSIILIGDEPFRNDWAFQMYDEYYSKIEIKFKKLKSVSSTEIVFTCDYYYQTKEVIDRYSSEVKVRDEITVENVDLVLRNFYQHNNTVDNVTTNFFMSLNPVFDDFLELEQYSQDINFNYLYTGSFALKTNLLVEKYYFSSQSHGNSYINQLGNYNLTTIRFASGFPGYHGYQNMFLFLDANKMEKTVVYDEYTYSELAQEKTLLDEKFDDVIKVYYEDKPYIKITVDPSWEGEYQSIQYWFCDKDDQKSSSQNGSMKFVFGVNLTKDDFTNGYAKVYISSLSTKDRKVYNEKRMIVGEITNFLDSNKEYGTNQYYDEYPSENESIN